MGRAEVVVEDAVMLPLIAVVGLPPTSCVRVSEVDEEDMVPLLAPVMLVPMFDIVPVPNVLTSRPDRETVGVASAPVNRADPDSVMTDCPEDWAAARLASQRRLKSMIGVLELEL